MLRPLVRQTWAPRGVTPIVRCRDRRDRLRVIGAITVPAAALRPRDRPAPRHRLSALFRIHTSNIRTPQATEFLQLLDRHVQGPLIVVQDRLNVHKAAVKRWLAQPARLRLRSRETSPLTTNVDIRADVNERHGQPTDWTGNVMFNDLHVDAYTWQVDDPKAFTVRDDNIFRSDDAEKGADMWLGVFGATTEKTATANWD